MKALEVETNRPVRTRVTIDRNAERLADDCSPPCTRDNRALFLRIIHNSELKINEEKHCYYKSYTYDFGKNTREGLNNNRLSSLQL